MQKRKIEAGPARARNYTTIVYPESAPENWLDILDQQHVPALVSPLHDRDVNPDGEPKKPHWHVLVMFDGVKTVSQAKNLFEQIGGVGCQKVNSIRGSVRYLCHIDNPEKAQYKPKDVKSFCGVDYSEICALPSDKYVLIKNILAFCEENDVINFADLLVYASENHDDWFRVLCDGGTFVVKEYIKARKWEHAS